MADFDDKRDINENDENGGNRPSGGRGPMLSTIVVLIISLVLALIFFQQFRRFMNSGLKEISYSQFLEMLDAGNVTDVEIYADTVRFTPKNQDNPAKKVIYSVVRTDDYDLVTRLEKANVEFTAIDEGSTVIMRNIIFYVIMIAIFYFLMSMVLKNITKGSGIMGVGKSNAKMYVQKKTGVTFNDVAGEEEAKESLEELVDFLHEPAKYTEIGAKLPKGALLVGPPGTGKTLLAKAVAGEADVPFFSISGSEFVELYVGVGASRVRDLFKQANSMAPCIIFIDEIDAIGRSRDTRHAGGDSEREQTLNQLLSEMDGFDSTKGIIVLAATNRPEVLDKALLRPGRFDRRVVVERPDMKGREDILRVHSKDVKIDETVDFHELALATSGAVGADLANIINEAALLAVKKGRKLVGQKDLLDSVEVVFAGKEKKDRLLSDEEKRVVAYHETGHALLTTLQKHTMPVQKITIIPRTNGALGYVWQVPEEEKYLETKEEMEAHIVVTMGGRAAEAIKFRSVTTGASNDIEQATKEARAMVTMYGMSDKFGMVQLESITGEYLDRSRYLNCSEETAARIDDEVREIIGRAYDKAYLLLKKNAAVLDAIAGYLYEHESISGEEFMKIFDKVSKEHKVYYELNSAELEDIERKSKKRKASSGTNASSGSVKTEKQGKADKLEKVEKTEKSEKKKKKKKKSEALLLSDVEFKVNTKKLDPHKMPWEIDDAPEITGPAIEPADSPDTDYEEDGVEAEELTNQMSSEAVPSRASSEVPVSKETTEETVIRKVPSDVNDQTASALNDQQSEDSE